MKKSVLPVENVNLNQQAIKYHKQLAVNYNDYHSQDGNLFLLQLEKIKGYLGVRPDSALLDVGCGAGRLMVPLAEQVGHIYGVEKSNDMYMTAFNGLFGYENFDLFNSGYQEFMNEGVGQKVLSVVDGVYFSYSLHQMGDDRTQEDILIKTKKMISADTNILVITTTPKQMEQNLVNKFFPGVDEIDKKRFFEPSWYHNRISALKSVEEHIVYKKYEKETYFEMLENKYISTLQMISENQFKIGLDKIKKEYAGYSFVTVPDFYTYILL
jgi:cyclopropane fatty-acyl-phospholipid synthase-like methyltransferase